MRELITVVIFLILLTAFSVFSYAIFGFCSENKELKFDTVQSIIIEDSVRICVPDSITLSPESVYFYTVWYNGTGIKKKHEIITVKPE